MSNLDDIYQYVDIDGLKSDVIKAKSCSFLQGSTLSSLLYIIYCNKIPLLHNLVNYTLYSNIINDNITNNFTKIDHKIVQYVDDSSNIVSSNEIHQLQIYINSYFKVIEGFYNLNKLLINSDKTKLLISCKPKYCNVTSNMILQANKYVINQSHKISVLGTFITYSLTNTAMINNIISKVNFLISALKEVF